MKPASEMTDDELSTQIETLEGSINGWSDYVATERYRPGELLALQKNKQELAEAKAEEEKRRIGKLTPEQKIAELKALMERYQDAAFTEQENGLGGEWLLDEYDECLRDMSRILGARHTCTLCGGRYLWGEAHNCQ